MIRLAKPEDMESIVEIHNHAVDARFQTAFMRTLTVKERVPWFYEHGKRYPLLVYEADGKVTGWLSISPYREDREALRYAAEVSYFIHKDYQKKGIGSQLLQHALNVCRDLEYKTLLAILQETNAGSIRLLEKFGFEKWAYLPLISDFDGIECGQVYYGLRLPQNKPLK